MKKHKKVSKVSIVTIVGVGLLWGGFLFPDRLVIPVQNATEKDWNHTTFWYQPWGESGVHKGIDIFAPKGTNLISVSNGIVIYKGQFGIGGNVLIVLGPKWRLHYYAHLESATPGLGQLVSSSEKIGTIGDSGNAKGKPAHLHYSVITLLPYLWRWDSGAQGWKKIFFLNPNEMLLKYPLKSRKPNRAN